MQDLISGRIAMFHLSFFCASYKPIFMSRIMAFLNEGRQRVIKGVSLLILLLTPLPHNVLAAELSPLAATSGYNTALINKNCDGFSQIPITSIQGTCVGLVAAKSHHLKQPRYAAQFDDKTLLVTDMLGWGAKNGTVWVIEFSKKMDELAANETQSIKITNLFSKNNLPNPAGIAVAPNGMVYIGLPTGIMKFKLQRNDSGDIKTDPELEVFINDFDQVRKFSQNLMAIEDYAHPMTSFSFSPDYRFIYVNLGSQTDSCVKHKSTAQNGNEICDENSGELPLSSVRRYSLDAQMNLIADSGITFANGLRNSMALTVHPSGLVVQGENAIDLPDSELPAEEINILQLSPDNKAQHYGWPYCYNDGDKVVSFAEFKTRKEECENSSFIPAYRALPGHSAPLGMIYPSSKKLPMLANTLLIGLHGYAAYGHKVVALPVDANGKPDKNAPLIEVLSNWSSANNLNPLGAPTGLLEWSDGSVIIMDDKNGAILRLSLGERVNKIDLIAANADTFKITEAMVQKFAPISQLLKTKCGACHAEMADDQPQVNLKALIDSGKLNLSGLEESSLLTKIRYRKMPPKTSDPKEFQPLTAAERKLILSDIVKVFGK